MIKEKENTGRVRSELSEKWKKEEPRDMQVREAEKTTGKPKKKRKRPKSQRMEAVGNTVCAGFGV